MNPVPDEFRRGPFHRGDALEAGIPARVLEGVQLRRLHEAVYVHRDHEMTWADHVAAARLALPGSARTTGVTRLRQLGWDIGPPFPLHFVVDGDLHLTLDRVFLHRTVKMPPCDDQHVTVEAAFVAFCADARLIDAIRIGCFLLHRADMDMSLLDQVLSEVNETIELRDGTRLAPDLWFEGYDLAVEYEGAQHLDDRAQYNADIDRYAAYRRNDVAYEQVTKELMRSPKAAVRRVHAALVARGYDGPAPDFEGAWPTLFMRLTDLVRAQKASA